MLKKDQWKVTFRGLPKTRAQHQRHLKKHSVANDTMFAAYVQMAKDYPETIEKYL